MQMAELQHTRRTSAVSTCAAVSTGSSRVARTILAEEVVAARKQLPGPGHRSTWARPAEHDAIVNPQHLHELQMLTAHTCTHGHARQHGAYVRAGARARACSRTQSGTALDATAAEAKRVQKKVRPGLLKKSLVAINGNVPLVF